MKYWQMLGLILVASMFLGATFVGMRGTRYEYATLELCTAIDAHRTQSRFTYEMSWRDSERTVDASDTSRDWTLVPITFFQKLDLPTATHNPTQKLERFLTALGSQGWQIHTVQYGTDGEKRIASYLMMRQMQ